MNRRRKINEHIIRSGALLPYADYMPSKKDLFDLLKNLQYRSPPETRVAIDALNEATKARKAFERSNKTWRRLSRVEKKAECELQRIRDSARESWENEIVACRDVLRLHGVNPMLKQRIERLLNGDGSNPED